MTSEPEQPRRLRLQRADILVVGGTSGIGLETARLAASEGANVIVASRSANDANLSGVASSGAIRSLAMDACDPAMIEQVMAQIPQLDHIVLSIGTRPGAPTRFVSTAIEDARRHFDEHFWTVVAVLRCALPLVRVRPESSVTIVTGSISRRPIGGKSFTASYQMALEGLARSLVDELAPIRINVVLPGLLHTPLWDDLTPPDRQSMFEAAEREMPVGRVVSAHCVADAITTLMANSYICGANLSVDGGWSSSRRI